LCTCILEVGSEVSKCQTTQREGGECLIDRLREGMCGTLAVE